MMAIPGWIEGIDAGDVLAWLLTYAVHSTILLGVAAVVTMRLIRTDAWRETVWRTALVGALATSVLQSGLGMRPLAGEWRFPLGERSGASAAELSKLTAAVEVSSLSSDVRLPSTAGSEEPGVGEGVGEGEGTAGTKREWEARARTTGALRESESGSGTPPTRLAPAVPSPSPSPTPSPAVSSQRSAVAVWSWVLLGSWAMVALLLLVRLAYRQWRLHRWLRDRRPVTEGDLLSQLAALRRNAGVWRPVELTASPACPSPLALGTSEICVPDRFLRELDSDQQRSALAHELAHIARRDPGWHLVTGLFEAVFFFQPLNRVARLRLREAAEHLSDDWAVRETGSALGLARCLAEVASWAGRGAAPAASGTMAMAEGGSPLLQRVERLLRGGAGHTPRARLRTVAATALVLSVLVAAPVVSAGGYGSDPVSGETAASGAAESTGEAALDGETGVAQMRPSEARPAEGSLAGPEPTDETSNSAESRVLAQEEVIRHGSPEEPLEERWQWAAAEAERRGDADYWVAYAFERPLPAGHIHVDDSGSWSTSEHHGVPLGARIYGPSYERPTGARQSDDPQEETSPESLQPVLVLFHMVRSRAGAAHIARVSVRSASAGMRLRGAPLYWLGPAPDAESFEWLRGRVDELQDTRLQATAVEAISMHETAELVVPYLEGLVASDRPDAVREDAVEGLGWQVTDRSVAVLRAAALEDHSSAIREEAAETLGELRTPAALTALDELLRTARSDAVREEAVEAVAHRQQPEVLEALEQVAMEDPSGDVRDEALDAIAGFPSSSSVSILERIALTHPRDDMRREAVEALGEVDPAAAADVLERLLQSDAHSGVREEALDVIAEQHSPRALEAIFQTAMNDPDPDLQDEAVDKLGEVDPAAALRYLERIVWSHPRTDIRREAVEALADLPADIALPVLDDLVERHEDPGVAREAVEAIGEFPSDLSVSRLTRIVREHPSEEVRREALDQLADRTESQ